MLHIDDSKKVMIDIFEYPEEKAEEVKNNRELCAKEAIDIMESICPLVKRTTVDETEGEGIFGYITEDETLLSVLLDPFEVPVMVEAIKGGNLRAYILAANGLTEPMLEALLKEYKEGE